ncbi:MAG TPA: Ig-like domain-containing protein, partial [Mycobacterium sp.]|nr:Ig-like domain-containing protein [Mycobacterium sp.]
MPFLFKLSKRVARLRARLLLVAAAAVAGACAKEVASPAGPAGGTEPVALQISAPNATPGESIAVTLRATEPLAAIQEAVAFDPQRLHYEKLGGGPDLVVVNDQAAAQGSLKVLATNPQGLAPAGVTLVFTVTASGYTNGIRGTLEIAVAPDDRLVWGAATAGLTRAAGASPAGGYRFGDVTLDGLINVWDVLLMSRVSGGTATLAPEAFLLGNVRPVNGGATATGVPPTCDPATTCRPGVTPGDALNPNGRIDNEDATAIANVAVGVAVPVVGELSPAGSGTPDTAVASVTVSPATANLHIGQTVQLTATPKNAAGTILTGRTVTWTSSNPSVATVSPSGQVTGVTPGSASITATSEGKSGSTTITVTTIPVASVAISPATANIRVRQTVQLTATPKDSAGGTLAGRTVMWASGDTSIVIVSPTGLVTGVAPGTAPITTMSEGKNSSATITVTLVPVASVAISPATASLQVGQTVQLAATPTDSAGSTLTGRTVSWTSSNTSVATVNPSGLVTAVVPGSATITATSEAKSGTATITVTTIPVTSVAISPATANIRVRQTVQLTATPKDSAGGTLAG